MDSLTPADETGSFDASVPGVQTTTTPVPFWGSTSSSVDWCEANYVVVSFIAEFLNTVSSLAITAFALFAWWQVRRRHPAARTPEITLAYVAVALVGVGSAAFHATLRHYEQFMDEVPMLVAASLFIYVLLADATGGQPQRNRLLGAVIASILLVAVVTYVALDVFVLFFAAYFVAVTFLVLYPLYTTGLFRVRVGDEADPRAASIQAAKRQYFLAAGFYLLAFAAWVWEQFRCLDHRADGTIVPLGKEQRGAETKVLPLHALWHLGAGLGSTFFVGFLVCLRSARQRRHSESLPFFLCCVCPGGGDDSGFARVEAQAWGENVCGDEFDMMNEAAVLTGHGLAPVGAINGGGGGGSDAVPELVIREPETSPAAPDADLFSSDDGGHI